MRIHLVTIGYGQSILGSLPPASVAQSYSRTLTAIGGAGTKKLEITSEDVPDTIVFTDNGDSTATFSMTNPQTEGTYSVTVRATDVERRRWSRTFELVIFSNFGPADIYVIVTLTTAGPYLGGQSVSFDIEVGNNGPSPATNIDVIVDPTNLTITGASGACGTLPCTIASIASGASTTITATATIDAAGAFSLEANVSADQTDPNPSNNTDSDGGTATAPEFVDDFVTVAAAYGLDKLISTATVALRVRRSSDNAEQDIGFDGIDFDETSLLAFVGANNGFVVTWYDQSGNGEHVSNATSSAQPQIVVSGVVNYGIAWDGSNDRLFTTSFAALSNRAMTVFMDARINTTGSGVVYATLYAEYFTGSPNGFYLGYDPRSSGFSPAWTFNLANGTSSSNTVTYAISGGFDMGDDFHLMTYMADLQGTPDAGGKHTVYRDGTLETNEGHQVSGSLTGLLDWTTLEVGGNAAAGFFSNCAIRSLVICAGDQLAQRANVEGVLSQ